MESDLCTKSLYVAHTPYNTITFTPTNCYRLLFLNNATDYKGRLARVVDI